MMMPLPVSRYQPEDYIKSIREASGNFANSQIDDMWYGYEVEVLMDLQEYMSKEEAIDDSKPIIYYYRNESKSLIIDFIRAEFKCWDGGFEGEELTEFMHREDNLFFIASIEPKDIETRSILESIAMYLHNKFIREHMNSQKDG